MHLYLLMYLSIIGKVKSQRNTQTKNMAVYMNVHSLAQVQSKEEQVYVSIYTLVYIQESKARCSKEVQGLLVNAR